MFFASISCSFRGFYNGNSNMKPTAMSQVIEQFLNVTLSLIFALVLSPFGIVWACAGATVGTTLGSLGSALYLKSAFKNNNSHLDRETSEGIEPLAGSTILRRLLSYAVPIAFNSIVVFGGDLVDLWNTRKRLLAALFTSDQAYISYGVLGKYTQLLNVPLAITAAMYIAVMPSFSRAIALKDTRLLKSHISEAFKTSLMISIPAAVGLGILSKPVFLLLFSQRYVEGWNLMAMGSVVIILVSIVQIQGGILQAVNKTRLSTISLIAGIIVKIFMNYFLIAIPSINIKGAVIGTIACYAVAIFINAKYIKKHVPIKIAIKKHMGRPVVHPPSWQRPQGFHINCFIFCSACLPVNICQMQWQSFLQ
jgi:stage V sporulation protein B